MSGIPAGAGQLLGKRLGKFEIVALLALGGTAEIYLARIGGAAGFEKYVVVKCLHDHLADDAEFVKMFLDEARLAAHLDHSNIVQTMELGQYEGRYYMVMEFLAGLSLAMIVRRVAERIPGGRLPMPLVLNILAQSAAGLHYAHEKAMNGKALNIVHRDISPQNLVISFEGVVKIVDFGIAKAEMRETRTRSGTIKGKFAYMSPEQCVANNVDRRTDVFALGVIGHELLTGRRLFKRPSPYETYQAVMECDVKPPSTFEGGGDPALDQVILGALTKDKMARYPTAEAFGDALLGYLHHRGIGSGPGDVSRFFDAHFAQEIEEHSGRMRELIAGRDVAIDAGVSWDVDDPEDEIKRDRANESARRRLSDGRGRDENDDDERETGAISSVLDDLGGGSRVEDDDEMPAERTRIEANPLERVNELERLARSTAKPSKSRDKLSGMPPSGPLEPREPLPTPPPTLPPSSVPAMPQGRFHDPANLPTMIAAGDRPTGVPPAMAAFGNAPTGLAPTEVPPASSAFGNAPTGLAPTGVPPASNAFGNAPTELPPASIFAKPAAAPGSGTPPPGGYAGAPTLAPQAQTLAPGVMNQPAFLNAATTVAPTQLPSHLPPDASAFANVPTTIDTPPDMASVPGPSIFAAASPRGATPGPAPAAAAPELARTQIGPVDARNAAAAMPLPYLDHNGQPPVAGSGPREAPSSSPPPMQAPPIAGGYPVMSAELSAQIATGATVFPSEQRPLPALHDSSPREVSPVDLQRAANLMSPVGQHYPEQVDWDAAAAAPARAVPPWLLAILFMGAIGIALALTIVIAKVAR